MAPAMKLEVLGFPGCPNTPQTKRNVEKAVASIGLAANAVYVDQEKLPENDRRRGWPTPTVLVDGRDAGVIVAVFVMLHLAGGGHGSHGH